MTTPALNTPYSVIYMAYRDAGLTGAGQDPDSEQLAEGMKRLNTLTNLWQTQGLKLWLQFDLPIVLTAGVNNYTLGPTGTISMVKPTRIIEAYYVEQGSTSQRPLIMLSLNEWDTLSTRISTGAINSYFPKKEATLISVFFWLTPDAQAATGTPHLIIQQQQQNVISLTEDMVFPAEWFLGLEWGLANQICTGQPKAIMDRCAVMATQYRTALEDWDVEDAATRFTPDTRSMYVSGGFR